MPEKQNMPIWFVTWSQFLVEPAFLSPSTRAVRMVMMRSAMNLHSAYLHGEHAGEARRATEANRSGFGV